MCNFLLLFGVFGGVICLHALAALATRPAEDAEVLPFAAATGTGPRSVRALDAIGGDLPAPDIEDLACNFNVDTCLWLNTGNVSWEQTSGYYGYYYGYGGSDDQWQLALGSKSGGQHFILESLEFNPTTATKALYFMYSLTGSSSSLQVEHKTEVAGWLPLFTQTGDMGREWPTVGIRVPKGTLALRFLAEADAESRVEFDEIAVLTVFHQTADEISAEGRATWASLSCSFEADNCTWSNILWDRLWLRGSGQPPSSSDTRSDTRPYGAFAGKWCIYTDASTAYEAGLFLCNRYLCFPPHYPKISLHPVRLQEFFLTSPMFAPSNVTRQLHFAYHMLGRHTGSLRLEFWSGSSWTPFWYRMGQQGIRWHLALVNVPEDAEMLRFVAVTNTGPVGVVGLDAIGVGDLPAPDIEDLACNFDFDTCLWLNTGNVSWEQTYGDYGYGNFGDDQWLLAAGSESEVQSFILESLEFNPTTAEKALYFMYSLSGSSSVSLQVEHKTEVAGWLPLFTRTGDMGGDWPYAVIRVPKGTLALRFLAEADAASTVQFDETAVLAVGDWSSLSCSFETDYCTWSLPRGYAWLRRLGQTPTGGTGPDGAFDGNWYIYTEASQNNWDQAGRLSHYIVISQQVP